MPPHAFRHRCVYPRTHSSHRPHEGIHESATCVPGLISTPAPTASTTPAPSCPSTAGQRVADVPSIALRSLWQTPLACSRTSTSPARGAARSSSRTSIGAEVPGSTAAMILTPSRRQQPAASGAAAPSGCDSASSALQVFVWHPVTRNKGISPAASAPPSPERVTTERGSQAS